MSVQVAVFACVHVLAVGVEHSLRLLARLEVLALNLVALNQFDPLDVVVFEHRVLNFAHFNSVAALDRLYNGHVLLCSSVNGAAPLDT